MVAPARTGPYSPSARIKKPTVNAYCAKTVSEALATVPRRSPGIAHEIIRRGRPRTSGMRQMVGERGFEPPAPASRRQGSTRLSYSPTGTRECDEEVAAGAKAAAR